MTTTTALVTIRYNISSLSTDYYSRDLEMTREQAETWAAQQVVAGLEKGFMVSIQLIGGAK